MSKAAFGATLGMILAVSGAQAQTVIVNNGSILGAPRASSEARRSTITMNIQLATHVGALASAAEFSTAINTANQSLEDVIQQECDVLSKTFKGDCRVVQMSLTSNAGNRNPYGIANGQPESVNNTANVTFEIQVLPPPAPDTAAKP